MTGHFPEFIAEFTEDVQPARTCDKCSAALQPNEGHVIQSFKPSQPDKLVCTACCNYYKNKPTTIRAAVAVHSDNRNRLPDPQAIRASVSAAQSKLSVTPPPVVAIVNQPMPPPPLPHIAASCHSQNLSKKPDGPQIFTPSVWMRGSSSLDPFIPPGPSSYPTRSLLGYGEQHKHYVAEQARWASAAQRVPTAETISLEVTAVYENAARWGHTCKNTIGSICEGLKDVNAQSNARELAALALHAVVPRIKAYDSHFPWQEDEFIVRDKQWVNLTIYDDASPYFYNKCLHPSKAKNSRVTMFKSTQFSLFVVVPEPQWLEYEQLKEKLECTEKVGKNALATVVTPPRVRHHHNNISAILPTTSSSLPSAGFSAPTAPTASPVASISILPQHQASVPPMAIATAKQQHHRSPSPSSISIQSPPSKRVPFYTSPNRDMLREALKSGSAKEFDLKQAKKQRMEIITFHPIPTLPLQDLRDAQAAFTVNPNKSMAGTLTFNLSTNEVLGMGTFKTAQGAHLTLNSLRDSGIGSATNHRIVIKRIHIGHGKARIMCPSFGEESNRLYREANVLYWAKALLKLMYDFIDHAMGSATAPPPFEIPRLHFVDAGLLLAYGESVDSLAGKAHVVNACWLAEEYIPTESTDDFVKYIHNGSAAIRKTGDEVIDEITEFLSFTQHVQYVKSHKQVFISDYQGCSPLLTDPQILTHPDVGNGKELFGDGNVETVVEKFEEQHWCNMCCLWPGFGLQHFGGSKE